MLVSKVKEIMEARKTTVRGLMEGTGLANETVLRARGKEISQCKLHTLVAIAKYLECTVNDLFYED